MSSNLHPIFAEILASHGMPAGCPDPAPPPVNQVMDEQRDLSLRLGKQYADEADDARLRAAAPVLLKACRQAIVALKGREHDGFLRDAIYAATGVRP